VTDTTDTEKALLGSILMDAKHFEECVGLLPDDFALSTHQMIFSHMRKLVGNRNPVDIVTLCQSLGPKFLLATQGTAYIASLTEGLPRRPNVTEYVKIIQKESITRRGIAICERAVSMGEGGEFSLEDTLRDLENLTLQGVGTADLESVGQYITTQDPMAQRQPGLPTGFWQYDKMSDGLHKGELTIVAARTSVGKTSMAGSLAMNISLKGKTVVAFLNEQSKRSFFFRIVSRRSGIPLERIKRCDYSEVERYYIEEAIREIKLLPMFWEAAPGITVPQMRTKCLRLKRDEGGLGVLIIDQLNHVPATGVIDKSERLRSDEVIGRIVMAIKDLAQDLQVPVVLMHQLNRDAAKTKERPGLETLKGSGSCEEHADNVLLLHRPEDATEGDAEIIVAKARDSATGICRVKFKADCCSWSD
jgi:replicative DNA helicase